jgi:hypothetical protein
MKRTIPAENSRLVLAVTLALWGGAVALAGWEGVFAKLSPVTFGLLALFASAYAAASYGLDRGLRSVAAQAGIERLWTAALLADAVLAVTAFAIARADAPAIESLARFPYALAALFVAPLAVALHAAAFGSAAARRRVRSAPARSPGANPAAT